MASDIASGRVFIGVRCEQVCVGDGLVPLVRRRGGTSGLNGQNGAEFSWPANASDAARSAADVASGGNWTVRVIGAFVIVGGGGCCEAADGAGGTGAAAAAPVCVASGWR